MKPRSEEDREIFALQVEAIELARSQPKVLAQWSPQANLRNREIHSRIRALKSRKEERAKALKEQRRAAKRSRPGFFGKLLGAGMELKAEFDRIDNLHPAANQANRTQATYRCKGKCKQIKSFSKPMPGVSCCGTGMVRQ